MLATATMYETLTGRPPFRGKDNQTTLSEIILREPEAPRKLNASIPQDIETITLKCLRKSAGDRYGTAEALEQDLRRFVRGDPTEARPLGRWERLSKLAVRYRRAIVLTAALLLLFAASSAVSVVLIAQAYHGERQAKITAQEDLYVADMRLAEQDWRTGNITLFVDLLARHRPSSGDPGRCGWERYYLESLLHVPVHDLQVCPEGGVQSIAWSPDGSFLASGSGDGSVRIWGVARGERRREFSAGTTPVRALDWNPRGPDLVAIYEDGIVCGWDAGSGAVLFDYRPETDSPVEEVSRAVSWSPDGSRFAASTGARGIEIRRRGDGQIVATLPTEEAGPVESLCWRFDGMALAAAFRNSARIVIWDATSWDRVTSRHAPGYFLYGITWSSDGSHLASAHNDHSIALWNVETLEELGRVRRAHQGDVLCVDWDPGGNRIVSGGQDGLVNVWDLGDAGIEALPISLRGHSHVVRQVKWSPDGSRIASASQDGTVKVWDPQVSFSGEDRRRVSHATWSPDGQWLARVEGGRVAVFSDDDGQEISTLHGRDRCFWAGFDHSGRFLAVLAAGDVVILWDREKRSEAGRLEGRHGGKVWCAAWNGNGWLATGGTDGIPRVWDIESLELVQELDPQEYRVDAISWSPDGSLLATSGMDARVKVWQTREWRLLHDLERQRRLGTRKYWTGRDNLAWSPGGDRLAAAASEKTGLIVWEMPEGSEVLRISGHASGIRAVAWSPDGRRLATGGLDDHIKLWDAETGDELLTLKSGGWAPETVEWCPDGQRLLSVNKDGLFRLWDARPGYDAFASRLQGE